MVGNRAGMQRQGHRRLQINDWIAGKELGELKRGAGQPRHCLKVAGRWVEADGAATPRDTVQERSSPRRYNSQVEQLA